ncbi:probable non-specific lipid-transfer protein 3 [Lolium perenne]|uniref:probable non-specific lipid-transfer protein 3 n=1 Tax=Lolium perenne TaxID=4522 RepID=UPI0021F52104|nr:probable non-specific lipid-transfer protein 3 [Lolium perenne]
MAASSKATAFLALGAFVVVLMAAGEASAAVTCGQVGSSLAPCIPYATGKSATLSQGCCSGMKSLNAMARTSADRQAVCRCLKSLAGSVKSVDLGVVAGAPAKCGVSVPFPINMSTDCNKVN